MHYRTLGKTGLKVSVIGFGTIKFPQISEKQASETLNCALDLGINFIDTARNYGDSEHKIGIVLKERREECYIATKTSSRSYEGAMKDLETSLRELQTDHIDLWQLHNVCDMKKWREVTAPGGALEAARRAKEEGIVDHIGISFHRALDVMREAIRCGEFEAIMVLYNPLDEENTGREIIPLAHEHNVGVIAMKPLSGGTLTLSISDEEREKRHHSSNGEWFDPIVRGCLRYIISNPAVSTVIPGMRFTWEVEENVKAADMPPMTDEEKDALIREIGKLRKTYKARLIEVAATDLGDEIEVVYYMDLPNGHVYLVKTRVPARKPEVESMASVCGSAAWYEREAYDHVGVVFKGHPGLRRVILPESVPPRFHPFRRKPI